MVCWRLLAALPPEQALGRVPVQARQLASAPLRLQASGSARGSESVPASVLASAQAEMAWVPEQAADLQALAQVHWPHLQQGRLVRSHANLVPVML